MVTCGSGGERLGWWGDGNVEEVISLYSPLVPPSPPRSLFACLHIIPELPALSPSVLFPECSRVGEKRLPETYSPSVQ